MGLFSIALSVCTIVIQAIPLEMVDSCPINTMISTDGKLLVVAMQSIREPGAQVFEIRGYDLKQVMIETGSTRAVSVKKNMEENPFVPPQFTIDTRKKTSEEKNRIMDSLDLHYHFKALSKTKTFSSLFDIAVRNQSTYSDKHRNLIMEADLEISRNKQLLVQYQLKGLEKEIKLIEQRLKRIPVWQIPVLENYLVLAEMWLYEFDADYPIEISLVCK